MTEDSQSTLERRDVMRLSGLAAVGSLAALAGCADDEGADGDGDEDEDEEQPDHPDEANDSNGGGGGPVDEENETGGHPDERDDEDEP